MLTTIDKNNNRNIINTHFNNINSYLIKISNNRIKKRKFASITENNSFRKIFDKGFRFDTENKNIKLNNYEISKIHKSKSNQENFKVIFGNKTMKKKNFLSKAKTIMNSELHNFSNNISLNKLYNDKIYNINKKIYFSTIK